MVVGLDNVRPITDALDALGNTTAATGKGFAIGSAVLTSLSLLNAFQDRVEGTTAFDYSVPDGVVLAGIIFGSMMPFLFGALTMISVGSAAAELMVQVRGQFAEERKEENAFVLAGQNAGTGDHTDNHAYGELKKIGHIPGEMTVNYPDDTKPWITTTDGQRRKVTG